MGSKYTVNYNYLENIDSPEKAQILGLLFADGCVYEKKNEIKISLIEDDRSYLEHINSLFSSNKILYSDNREGERFYKHLNKSYKIKNSITLSFHNKKLMQDCMRWGVIPNKTYLDVDFPKIPEYLLNSFFLGLFEGDGCLSMTTTPSKRTDKQYQLHSLHFLLQEKFTKYIVSYLENECGIHCKYRLHQNCKNNLYRITITRITDLIKIYHLLYKNTSFVMSRKHDKFVKLLLIFKSKGYDIGELFNFDK